MLKRNFGRTVPEDHRRCGDRRGGRRRDRRTPGGERRSSDRAQFSRRGILERAADKKRRLKTFNEAMNAEGKRRERVGCKAARSEARDSTSTYSEGRARKQ